MATTILRSNVLTAKMQIITKNVLCSGTNHSLQTIKPACMLNCSARLMGAAKEDELYRQVTIEVKGHDQAVLSSYEKFTTMAAQGLDVNIVRIYEPPKIIARMSLMKSVFVHKKHFHQYEMRTHFRVFEIKNITGSTASTFLEYVQRNLPEGVAMKVTKHQVEKFPEHIKPPSTAAKSTIPEETAECAKVTNAIQEKSAESSKITSSSKDLAEKSTETVSSSQDKLLESEDYLKTSADVDSSVSEAHTTNSSTSLPKSKKTKKSKSKRPSEDKP